ncbi:hypothetical protein [Alistipes finegoldii]|uniref:hypothetical protein n=1 Tax=Alistipes finegoldii TaxID=214856 RepID=UPI00242FA4C7|nr:hypothetical protein [Alistipes finegoldii]
MSILAGLGAAAASFAMKEGHNAIAQSRNEKNMALEHDYWKRRVNQLEEMNKPSRQVAKWRSAGIAPQAVFGNSPGGAGIATDASAPNSQTPTGSSDFNFVTTIAERQRMKNEKAIADATVNKLNAEAEKLRGDTKDPNVTKDSQRLEFDWNLVKKQREQVQLAVDEINKEFQRAINEADVQIKHGLYSETLAKIDKLIADKDVSEEMKQNLQKQRDLIESQISATQAQTDFTKAQTMTENMSRDDRIREIKSRINNLVSSTNLNDENARSALYSRLADVLGLVMPSSAVAGAAQEVIKSRRLDNYVFNRMSDDEVRRFLDALDSKK